ncbi:MAG: hypothetical protein HRU76_09755 [Phycisphaeraceae bacterium]|nr:MAG: hypothetical protein HRU76_09755 [Phycisphaeraceae bacterium]
MFFDRCVPAVCLNYRLDGATLVLATKKPCDELVEGLDLSNNRGDSTPIELFVQGIRSWGPETRVLLAVKP